MTTDERIKLVIADDHQVFRQALSEVLEAKGRYDIIGEASDGSSLLDTLQGCTPDIILLDLAMPRVGGIAAIHELKERGCSAPVLVLSADESDRSIKAALQAGAKGFLPKQVTLNEVEFAIDSVIKGNTYISPAVTDRLMSNGGIEEEHDSPLSRLSKREREIMTLIASGKPNREIGQLLHISTRTVDTHRGNILKKLKLKTNADLVRLAIASGLITAA